MTEQAQAAFARLIKLECILSQVSRRTRGYAALVREHEQALAEYEAAREA